MNLITYFFLDLFFPVRADDETSTAATTLSNSDTASKLSSDDITELIASTEASTKAENVSSTDSAIASATAEATNKTEEPILVTTERLPVTTNAQPDVNSTEVFIKLTNQIRMILEHLQAANATGLPGENILPDPLPAPDVSEGLGLLGKSEFYNMTVHGLSNFTVEGVNMMLDQMTVSIAHNIICWKNKTLINPVVKFPFKLLYLTE